MVTFCRHNWYNVFFHTAAHTGIGSIVWLDDCLIGSTVGWLGGWLDGWVSCMFEWLVGTECCIFTLTAINSWTCISCVPPACYVGEHYVIQWWNASNGNALWLSMCMSHLSCRLTCWPGYTPHPHVLVDNHVVCWITHNSIIWCHVCVWNS